MARKRTKVTSVSAIKVPKGVQLDALSSPIDSDGKWQAPKGTQLVIARTYWKRAENHLCTVHEVNEETGIVQAWDDTVQHFFAFSYKEQVPSVLKVFKQIR